jgi:hypothetical protein
MSVAPMRSTAWFAPRLRLFVAFQSLNQGRSGAEVEAVSVLELFRTAQFFPAPEAEQLQAEIVGYARAAVTEWGQ